MNQKILKIITVLMLVITLTMANFVLLCADVVSYANDVINADKSTNNKNVEFIAYLKNEKGEKVNSFDAKMNASKEHDVVVDDVEVIVEDSDK